MKVHIRLGKGKKDRFVTLPQASLVALRHYWVTHRHLTLLLPAGTPPQDRHTATRTMDRGGLQKAFKVIVADQGNRKPVTIHSLRHCYGAHLVESGVNLWAIQHEMGHACPKTTALYTQLTEVTQHNTGQLINRLNLQLDGEV